LAKAAAALISDRFCINQCADKAGQLGEVKPEIRVCIAETHKALLRRLRFLAVAVQDRVEQLDRAAFSSAFRSVLL
jgi:hypothetical protein